MSFPIIRTRNNTYIIQLRKDITVYQLQDLQDTIQRLRDKKGNKNVIVDMRDVSYIDAFAIGALTSLAKEARENGGDLKIVRISDDIKTIFELSHLSKVFDVYERIEEAEKSF